MIVCFISCLEFEFNGINLNSSLHAGVLDDMRQHRL